MHRGRLHSFLVLPLTILATSLAAQVIVAPGTPQVGSSNPVSPEPPVSRPSTTPCTVPLLTEQAFADFNNKPIAYTPPSKCPGPWAKVVFSADFTVTAGRQYDRTAKFFLGGANIYFGTTAEPRSTLSPSWHVERDVTELSTIFRHPEVGVAELGNFVGVYNGVTYNGIVYANARLQFYPADAKTPAAAVPDYALGFPKNDTTRVSSTTDKSTGVFTFPKNLERVYLDVIAQSQSTDEFWYLSVPSNVATELETTGNTGFRETEVSIDGKPAGVAPVYPWIYTGGIDPYLWEPITGIETLNLKPYRVDLSPFAGILADGKDHTVSVSVFNANSGFDVASTLLLYTGPANSVTTGNLITDTLTAPSPQVRESLTTASDGTVSGVVSVTSSRAWTIAGYINTSHGRVDTTVRALNSFGNLQHVKVSSTVDEQNLTQQTDQQEQTTVQTNTGRTTTQHSVRYPVNVNYNFAPLPDGSYAQTTYVKQNRFTELQAPLGANSPNPVVTNETVETTDVLHYDSSFNYLGHYGAHATASYGSKDPGYSCYVETLVADALQLTSVQNNNCSDAP